MSRFAEKTEVTTRGSRDEIERTLERYGADQFLYGWQDDAAVIGFRMKGRHIKFVLPLPSKTADEFTTYMRGSIRFERDAGAATKLWEQATRQRWRALSLIIKAKLEAIESGISLFEDEFLAATVLPNKQTAGEWMRPQIDEAYRIGAMPSMLPMLEGPKAR